MLASRIQEAAAREPEQRDQDVCCSARVSPEARRACTPTPTHSCRVLLFPLHFS